VLSYAVFKTLFPSEKVRSLIKGKKLSIIPDGYLSLLPFEALSTSETTTSYLIEDCDISYLYSWSFLQNNLISTTEKANFLAMAPVDFTNSDLSKLVYSKDEIKNLKKYYPGESYLNEQASKSSFLNALPNYSMVHLATHADASDSITPWIAFSDSKLTLDEIYLTQNKASLVVLSGCNTTLGRQEVGEGVMSLARGFFYSGTQSVISSLWSIDDRSTPFIMKKFYKNLHDGKTKSTALRNAKLAYLKTHSLSEASPYYWASFILIGKDDALTNSIPGWIFYIIFAVALLLLFLWLKRYKKAKRFI